MIVGGGCASASLHEIVDGQSLSNGETTPTLKPNYHQNSKNENKVVNNINVDFQTF